jgi:hypothetical protein
MDKEKTNSKTVVDYRFFKVGHHYSSTRLYIPGHLFPLKFIIARFALMPFDSHGYASVIGTKSRDDNSDVYLTL